MKILPLLLALFAVTGSSAWAAPSMAGYPPLKNAIVLVHGATEQGSRLKIGPLDFGEYFRLIPGFYQGTGTPVHIAQLSTDSSIAERAAILKNFLETELKGKRVNVIGHSLGGLDARYAATILGAGQIASITTIGTPHRGTPLANWAARQADRGTAWYWLFRLVGYDIKTRRFLKELTTEHMEKLFNPKVPNREGVQYFSVSTKASFGEGNMSYLLWFTTRWLEGESHPLAANGHDGLVPLDSQPWGKEIVRANLDHLGQMNHHEFRSIDETEASLEVYRKIYETLRESGL